MRQAIFEGRNMIHRLTFYNGSGMWVWVCYIVDFSTSVLRSMYNERVGEMCAIYIESVHFDQISDQSKEPNMWLLLPDVFIVII